MKFTTLENAAKELREAGDCQWTPAGEAYLNALADAIEEMASVWKCNKCGCMFPRIEHDQNVFVCSSCCESEMRLGRIKEMWHALYRIASLTDMRHEDYKELKSRYGDGPYDVVPGWRVAERMAEIAREALER